MAYRTGDTRRIEYTRSMALAKQMKLRAEQEIANMAAGPVSAVDVLELGQDLAGWHAELTRISQVSGIVQYAKDDRNDQTYNVAAEFNSMLSAIQTAALETRVVMPRSNNTLTHMSLSAALVLTVDTVSTADTAQLRIDLQAAADSVTSLDP